MKIKDIYNVSPFLRGAGCRTEELKYENFIDYDYAFTYVFSGRLKYKVAGVEYTLVPGNGLLAPPFVSHLVTSDPEVGMFVVHFDLFSDPRRMALTNIGVSAYKGKVDDTVLRPEREEIFDRVILYSFHAAVTSRLKAILETLTKISSEGNGDLLQAKAELIRLLDILVREETNEEEIARRDIHAWPLVMKAAEYMENHYADPDLSNEEIYEKIGLSKGALTKIFKNATGLTIHQYLLNVRVSHAVEMLTFGKSVAETQKAVGFISSHSFVRAFKSIIGQTPIQFFNNKKNK